MSLKEVDKEIFATISDECQRQSRNINLIASENYASKAVLQAQGSVLTNKYAEGYPGHRYYGGCEFIDDVETTSISRAMNLFGSDYANVQPHSGAQANMAAYFALLSPGDTVMGMSLDQGGHLTHGSSVNFSAKLYNFISYGVDRVTEAIDFNQVSDLAEEFKPKLIIAGASAYSQIIDFHKFREICDIVGAKFMVDMAHISGLVAAHEHPSPVNIADIITSTTHKTLRGPRGGLILAKRDLGRAVNSAVFPNMQGGPLQHVIAAKAVAFHEATQPEFVKYQQNVRKNARELSNTLKNGGLRIVSGSTKNHMVLVDLTNLGITGRQAEDSLGKANIVVNRNAIPFDTKPPRQASGIRLGTAAITSRGMDTKQIQTIGNLILQLLNNMDNVSTQKQVKQEVLQMTKVYPVPGIDF